MNYQLGKLNKAKGFTIVELLVVIVVIGILASITIVAYNGVSNRAKTAKAQSTASAIQKKVELYNAEPTTSGYPATYSLLTASGASTSTYYIPAGTYTLKTTAVATGDTETTFNYSSCATPTGYRVSVWDWSAGAVAHTYIGGATSLSTCTLITS